MKNSETTAIGFAKLLKFKSIKHCFLEYFSKTVSHGSHSVYESSLFLAINQLSFVVLISS